MALDIFSVQSSSPRSEGSKRSLPQDFAPSALEVSQEALRAMPADLQATIRDIQKVSEAFNRRLSFSVNEKIGQVVVKVIDNDTDKVVREIPPVELQHVYERLREAIGLLFDKSA